MQPESIEAMGEVAELSNAIHELLQRDDSLETLEEAHRLTTAANSLMLTVLCHELLDGGVELSDVLFRGIAGEFVN